MRIVRRREFAVLAQVLQRLALSLPFDPVNKGPIASLPACTIWDLGLHLGSKPSASIRVARHSRSIGVIPILNLMYRMHWNLFSRRCKVVLKQAFRARNDATQRLCKRCLACRNDANRAD